MSSRKAKKIGYSHVIDRRPARYDGTQIVYCNKYTGIYMVDDLKTIKKQQKLSKAWRKKRGFKKLNDYGHIIIRVEEIKETR